HRSLHRQRALSSPGGRRVALLGERDDGSLTAGFLHRRPSAKTGGPELTRVDQDWPSGRAARERRWSASGVTPALTDLIGTREARRAGPDGQRDDLHRSPT